jgi:hypothetical protein
MSKREAGGRTRAGVWVVLAVAALVGLAGALAGPTSAPASANILTGTIKVDPMPR